jgi:hypothetical protein
MPVPVYDCHVLLSPPDRAGMIHARVSTLPEITASGRVEREVLQQIVRDFKAALVRYRSSGQPVPWAIQPDTPRPGESQRWIPVHL